MISFLFLTQNRLGVTARCFRSLAPTLHRQDVEWRILDNGSTDGTADWLLRMAAQYPGKVHVTLYGDNTGVAGGRQILLDAAQGEMIVILDSDVEARRDGWMGRLLAPLRDRSVGLCGPAGHWVTAGWEWYEPCGLGYVGPSDVVSGYCQAFRRDVIRGFEMDMYFNPYFHEDSDMCLWIKDKGYQVWCTGEIGLFHVYAGTGDRGGGKRKQKYLAGKWQGKKLVRHEQEANASLQQATATTLPLMRETVPLA